MLVRFSATTAEKTSPRWRWLLHAVIHKALAQAVRWSLIPANVTDAVDAPKPRQEEVKPLTREQAHAFLEAAEADELHALWVVLLTGGLRIGEALALRWEDVELDEATMRVARTLSWERGSKPRYGSPKNGKARSIGLTPRTVEALRHHRTRQAAARLAAPVWVDGPDLVFTDAAGRPLRRDGVYRRNFRPLLERTGLPKDTRIHALRHTTATTLLAQGVDVISVQRLLGHSSAAMTLGVYGHFVPSMGEATARAMEAALG